MNILGKFIVLAFLFLLAGMALTSAQPRIGIGTAQLGQEQEKLCLTCHAPRVAPNDTAHEHTHIYDWHAAGSPCYVCHGNASIQDAGGGVDPHNPANVNHPSEKEASAMGKSDLDCRACHYQHNIQEELQAGSITSVSPPLEPRPTTWALMVVAVVSLVTSVSGLVVTLLAHEQSSPKNQSRNSMGA
jgi:hypothetical protein